MKILKTILCVAAVVAGATGFAEAISWLPARTATNNSISPEKDWFVASNWDLGRIPQDGDDVYITNSVSASLYYINVTNSTPHLASLTMRHSYPSGNPHYRIYLTMRNWTTCLRADTFHIMKGAQITCPGNFTNTQMSNRVWCVGQDMTLDYYCGSDGKDGGLYADLGGYAGCNGPGYACYPEVSPGGQFAGSYGGASLNTPVSSGAPKPYGSAEWPFEPGTGGGATTSGSSGGGAIFVDLTGDLTVNGVISACSGTCNGNCSGSGGGIVLKCRAIKGSGTVSASGLAETLSYATINSGGGRIAVHYDAAAQAAAMADCKVRICALPGSRGIGGADPKSNRDVAQAGTIWLTDDVFLTSQRPYRVGGMLEHPRLVSPVVIDGDFSMDGALFSFSNAVSVKITGDLSVVGVSSSCQSGFVFEEPSDFEVGGKFDVTQATVKFRKGGSLKVDGDLALINKAAYYYYGGEIELDCRTDGEMGSVGSSLTVGGTLTMNPMTLLVLKTDPTSGTVPKVTANDIAISNTAYVLASSYGYPTSSGPGYKSGCGASHGGRGAPTAQTPAAYGKEKWPVCPGSGGAVGAGGGVIYMEALRNMTFNGTAAVKGGSTSMVGQSGWHAGSGGSILLLSRSFYGTTGSFIADGGYACGGSGNAYGGAGGRIAIRTAHDCSDHAGLTLSVKGGTSGIGGVVGSLDPAEDGTIYWGKWQQGLTILVR